MITDKQAEKLRADFERVQALTGPSRRKDLIKQLDGTRKLAEKLIEHLEVMSFDEFPGMADDGKPDYGFLSRLSDALSTLVFRIEHYEAPKSENLRGRAENHLTRSLWGLCDDPKCYYSEISKAYAGSFVDFLAETLPQLGIETLKVQAYAQRAFRMKLGR